MTGVRRLVVAVALAAGCAPHAKQASAPSPASAASSGEAPAPDLSPRPPSAAPVERAFTRVLLGSCYDQSQPDGTWEALRALGPDLYLAAGDNIYADVVREGGRLKFIGDPLRVEAAYRQLRDDPSWERFQNAVPILPMWDDHDFGLNDAGADLPFAARSEELFLDFWRVPADDPRRARPGVYHAETFNSGDLTIQVILLDTRRFRSPIHKTPSSERGVGPYAPHPDPALTLLGEDQWTWLEQQLLRPADLRFLLSGIQVLPVAHRYERWGVFPHERARLFELIEHTQAEGVVLLSGDRHFGSLYRETEGVPYPIWEITSSSLNKSFGGLPMEPAPLRVGPQVAVENVGILDIHAAERMLKVAIADKSGRPIVQQEIPLDDLRSLPDSLP